MKKSRKSIHFLLMFTMLLCLLVTPAFAGNANYSFSLKNTGGVFNYDASSESPKENAYSYDKEWIVNVKNINFKNCSLSGTLGMAFCPLTYKASGDAGAGYYFGSVPTWTKSEGKIYAPYNGYYKGVYYSKYGAKGKYVMSARLDDLLKGTATANGVWNADSK